MNPPTDKRRKLLAELEFIIGNECFSSSMQNHGPGGQCESQGRQFRYPLTYYNGNFELKLKGEGAHAKHLPYEKLRDAYYAFGTNRLNIIRALEKVIARLERDHALKI